MAVYHLPYGHASLSLNLPETIKADWIEPPAVMAAQDPLQVVRNALDHPVDGRTLSDYLPEQPAAAYTVAIAINDKTRPVPHEHLLPPLLDALHRSGVPSTAIRFFIATGTHLPMLADEFGRVLSKDLIEKYAIVSHNCDNPDGLVRLGTTPHGTPILVNRDYMAADLRIVVGNIEPHHFAGFSGGYKTAAIGLAGRETINRNHTLLMEPDARIAEFTRNPLRQDIEAIGSAMQVHFALNAILNGEKKVVEAVCGNPSAVMQAGIPISRSFCQVTVPSAEKYDLVIASVGGAPKDINFYQSQKALTHASLLTRDGGVIILAAECPEGSGSRTYEAYMEGLQTPQAVFDKFRRTGFEVGPHKSFQVARDAARLHIVLVSSISPALVSKLLMTPASNLAEAFNTASAYLSPSPTQRLRVAILPRATNTIPMA